MKTKLVTIFVICDVNASPKNVREHIGKTIERTIEDPQVVHDRKNQDKVMYWKDMEFSNDYPIDHLINELSSEFPQYVIFDITRPAKTFREKHSWWLGIIATSVISAVFAIVQIMNGD